MYELSASRPLHFVEKRMRVFIEKAIIVLKAIIGFLELIRYFLE
ncbi:damage-inducible type I toxin DinQ [Phytobacter sp. AG2a]|jgi:hypothetical protein